MRAVGRAEQFCAHLAGAESARIVPLPKGGRVAVIVGLGTEMELYRHRARVTLRERFGEDVSPEKRKRAMSYVNRVGTSTSYVSYIGNLVATRVSSQLGFTGPAFTVTEGGNSVFRALDIARELLLILAIHSGCNG